MVHWAEEPAEGATNPEARRAAEGVPWPAEPSPERSALLSQVVRDVTDVDAVQPAIPSAGAGSTGRDESERIEHWDVMAAALLEEARARQSRDRVVRLPDTVSASVLMRALEDPGSVAMDLVRPMPRPPAPSARRGTRLHAWIEARYGQQSLLDPDDLPGAGDEGIGSDEALERLKAAFESGPYARRAPVAVEEAFAVMVGGRVVNGRIDAVFERDGRFEVVDWKTGSVANVHPLQLALYRIAWSQLRGVPVDQVDAAFVMVETGEVLRPDTDAAVAVLGGG